MARKLPVFFAALADGRVVGKRTTLIISPPPEAGVSANGKKQIVVMTRTGQEGFNIQMADDVAFFLASAAVRAEQDAEDAPSAQDPRLLADDRVSGLAWTYLYPNWRTS